MIERPRRLRQSGAMRGLVRETHLRASAFIEPMFVRDIAEPVAISSMPGVVQHSFASLAAAALRAQALGVSGIMLFGVPAERDALGTEACDAGGILSRALRETRDALGPNFIICADVCLDEFTDHGHCGVLTPEGGVDNDATVAHYADMAVVCAEAGANMVGLSGMMDGQVGVVRTALDDAGFDDVVILAYSAKYASAFYGPFREAVQSRLEGDRRTYQQDPANRREAMREVRLDLEQGADIVMVKPALPYLDVLSDVRARVDVPVAAYVVSGEYAMIEAAAANGWINREAAILEALTSVSRAGADIICTYWASEVAGWLKEQR
jgi:porphobilinogen synthase